VARLIYIANVSLDGYTEDESGDFQWTEPDDDVFGFITDLIRPRFRGNPTKSYRSRQPLRVMGEVTEWQGHPPEVLEAMRSGVERLDGSGGGVIDD
jgi:rifampin ADP-ribosylating transferase